MTRRPRRYYYDLPVSFDLAPEPGDVLRGPRVDHLVVDVWPTDSAIWPNRWTVTVRSLGPQRGTPNEGGRIWPVEPYRRGEGPHDHFGDSS